MRPLEIPRLPLLLPGVTEASLHARVALTGDGWVLQHPLTSTNCLPGTVPSVVFAMCLKVAVSLQGKAIKDEETTGGPNFTSTFYSHCGCPLPTMI